MWLFVLSAVLGVDTAVTAATVGFSLKPWHRESLHIHVIHMLLLSGCSSHFLIACCPLCMLIQVGIHCFRSWRVVEMWSKFQKGLSDAKTLHSGVIIGRILQRWGHYVSIFPAWQNVKSTAGDMFMFTDLYFNFYFQSLLLWCFCRR